MIDVGIEICELEKRITRSCSSTTIKWFANIDRNRKDVMSEDFEGNAHLLKVQVHNYPNMQVLVNISTLAAHLLDFTKLVPITNLWVLQSGQLTQHFLELWEKCLSCHCYYDLTIGSFQPSPSPLKVMGDIMNARTAKADLHKFYTCLTSLSMVKGVRFYDVIRCRLKTAITSRLFMPVRVTTKVHDSASSY